MDTFKELLELELRRSGLSIREVSKRISRDPDHPIKAETARRMLHKYLAGDHSPTLAVRGAIARAFGRPPDFFGVGGRNRHAPKSLTRSCS